MKRMVLIAAVTVAVSGLYHGVVLGKHDHKLLKHDHKLLKHDHKHDGLLKHHGGGADGGDCPCGGFDGGVLVGVEGAPEGMGIDRCKNPGMFPALKLVKAYATNEAYASEYFETIPIQVSGRVLAIKKIPPNPEVPDSKEMFAMSISPDGKPPKLPYLIGLTFIFEDEDRCKLSEIIPGQFLSVKGTFFEKLVDPGTGYTEVKFAKARLVP